MPRIIDLSHSLDDGSPSYPGDPPVRIRDWQRYEHGYLVSQLELGTHTGTHVDAPAHRIVGGRSVTDMDVGAFIGFRVYVADLAASADLAAPADKRMGAGDDGASSDLAASADINARSLAPFERALEGCDGILIKTGWSSRWGGAGFFTGYPSLGEDAAEFLCRMGIRIIGVESPSVSEASHLETHAALLGRGITIVESVACMDGIRAAYVEFHAVPLKLLGRDGSPARAYAIERD